MIITVNNTSLELHEGARVKDAILKYYSQLGGKMPRHLPEVHDNYGNKVAADGELTDGDSLLTISGRKRRSLFRRFFFLIVVSGSVLACSSFNKSSSVKQSERQAVIFAVNDMHAAIDNFPKLSYIVDSLRTVYPDMLLVSAGDNQTGNPVNDQYPEKGLPVIELMNAAGFDLCAVGNHEFDSRPEGFSYLTHKAKFSFICANVSADKELDIKIEPYKIVTLPNGLKLAFLGLLQINKNGIPDSHPDNMKGFGFVSPFDVAREYIKLKDQSDILIALTHLGFGNDVQLAETMPEGIDLIIGGHSHTRVEKEQIHNGVMITQAENKLKYGTLIRLTLERNGMLKKRMELIDIRNSVKEKPSVRAMVDKYNDNRVLREEIAISTDDFSSCEELGYLMADAHRDAAKADIALVNPGGVRINHLRRGPVLIMNVFQLDPFGNELVVIKLTGQELRSLMLAAFEIDERLPVYPSGIRTELILGEEGDLKSVNLLTENGTELKMDQIYTVAMNSYMAQTYRYEHSDPGQSLFISTADALIAYLKKMKNIRSYHGDKRIRIKG